MSINYIFLVVFLFCLVHAKYVFDESASMVVIRKQKSISDEPDISNILSNDSATDNSLHNYLVSHVNSVYIQRLSAELETKIPEIGNETARFLQNVTLPWVTEAQEVIQQKKNTFRSVLQYLTNWITGGETVSANVSGTNVDSSAVYISGAAITAPINPNNPVSVTNSQGNPAVSFHNVLISEGKGLVNGTVVENLVTDTVSGNPGSTSGAASSGAPTGVEMISTVSTETITFGANVSVVDPTETVLSDPSIVVPVSAVSVDDSVSVFAQAGSDSLGTDVLVGNSGIANGLTHASSNASSLDTSVAISSNGAPVHTNASMDHQMKLSDETSPDTGAAVTVFFNATNKETNISVALDNYNGKGTSVLNEVVTSSTTVSPDFTNESSISVTEAFTTTSSDSTNITSVEILAITPAKGASSLTEVATPSKVTQNSSIATAADRTIIKVVPASSELSVVNASENEVSVTNSFVSTTELGIVTDTENIRDTVSTSAPEVDQTNAT